MRILPLQKLLSLIVVMCASVLAFAQPANDDCSTPTLLVVGADAASCIVVAGDTRETVDSRNVNDPLACSVNWVADDVWYTIETGATIPQDGITIEVRLDAADTTSLIDQGLAIYTASCDTLNEPILCNIGSTPGIRTITFPPQCLDPNTPYLIRLWSAPEPFDNSGTFSICAYVSPPEVIGGEPAPRIIYEETFDDGLGAWTSVATTMREDIAAGNGELVPDDWIWSATGCIPNAFGDTDCLTIASRTCQPVGVVGIPAGWIQTGRTGDVLEAGNQSAPPYHDIFSYLVSPSIDLSKEACVNLNWIEAHRGLNNLGGARSETGPLVEYSIDGGATWVPPSAGTGSVDVSTNYGGEYETNGPGSTALQRSIPLLGAEGNSDVRIRFGLEGNFYYWILDDIQVVQGTPSDLVAQSNFFARTIINPMSVHQVDSYDFLIDIANLACEDQTNVNVNVTAVNSAGNIVHDVNLPYGSIQSDSLAQNVPFNQPFTPSTDVDSYTLTYTASSDADDDLTNNVRSFNADVVDELMFRKEDGVATGAFSPIDGLFVPDEPFNWEMGHLFYAPNATSLNGEPLEFTTISFQLGNADVLINENLNVWLYKVTDTDFDGILEKDDPTQINIIGGTVYTVTGTETGLITVDLTPFGSLGLAIEANTHYMAAVESTLSPASAATQNMERMTIANSDAYDYSAAIFNAKNNAGGDLTRVRYAHGFAISTDGYFRVGPGVDLSTTNFNEGTSSPLIRLGFAEVEEIDNATVEINNDINIEIAPNPASTNITVDLSIKEATDMDVSIVNLTGQRIMTKSFNSVTELRENFDVSNFASGVYMIHIRTKDGIQTKKFVVSK